MIMYSKEKRCCYEDQRCRKASGDSQSQYPVLRKKGLIRPGRSENGYREYSDADLTRLKQIVILRKLGVPVQQISNILDGRLSLQDAMDHTVILLENEIRQLTGALELCKKLRSEETDALDTQRYWELIHTKEQQGYLFQSIKDDYLSFVKESILDAWYLPESAKQSKHKVFLCILLYAAFWGLIAFFLGLGFFQEFRHWIFLEIGLPCLLGLCLIPAFLIRRKDPEKARIAEWIIRVILAILVLCFGMWRIVT